MTIFSEENNEELKGEVFRLREENEKLRRTVTNLRCQLRRYRNDANRRARHDQDYLPYEDDRRE